MFGPSRYLSVPLLWPLLTPDQSRRRLLAVALWPSLRSLPVRSSAASSLPQRPDHSVEQRSPLLLRNVGNRLPIRSPQVRTRCFRAQALHLPCPPYPMGFVMRCQLARRPGLLCSFCPSPRTFALRLPPDKSSRACPCLRLVVIIDSCRIHVGTPTGDFHPITSRPCWAHTLRSRGTLRRQAGCAPLSAYFTPS